MKPTIQDTIQLLKTPRTFNLFFGPYGIGVSRPILRERATFGTLNQMVSESGKPPIPHGLVVRIRAFHARGRGSIPRGGDLRQHTAIRTFSDLQSERAGSIPALENTSVWLTV